VEEREGEEAGGGGGGVGGARGEGVGLLGRELGEGECREGRAHPEDEYFGRGLVWVGLSDST
jgi:hypothetical protein